jgi:hypothetical protein
MLRSSSTTLRPRARAMATDRISSATSGSAWIITSVWPLANRATSTASSKPAPGPTRGSESVGETRLNQIRSLWKRRTRAIRQRSNSSPSVRESRQAAAKALGRVTRDG